MISGNKIEEQSVSLAVEQQADLPEHWDGECLRITGPDGSLLGLCLLSVPPENLHHSAIVKAIGNCAGVKVVGSLNKSSGKTKSSRKTITWPAKSRSAEQVGAELLPDNQHFDVELAAVVKRASSTRLPFSVILMQPDFKNNVGKVDPGEVVDSINFLIHEVKGILDPDDLFCRFGSHAAGLLSNAKQQKFAILMQAAGLSRARVKAEIIRKSFKKEVVANKSCLIKSISLGVGVAHATDNESSVDFIKSVEKCLREAAADGNSVRWGQKIVPQHSCQVTAEERSQLFKGLS